MKKLLLGLCAIFVCTIAIAHSIEWYVDNTLYQTTTCNSGDNITPPTAPEKYGYTFDRWLANYIELEYIESTGTQYINTKQDFKKDIHIYLSVMYTSIPSGSYGFGRNAGAQEILWEGTKFYFGGGYSTLPAPVAANTMYDYDLDFTAGAMVAKINGDIVRETTETYNQQIANRIYLFATNNRDTPVGYPARFYSFKLTNGSGTVQDLIPAKRLFDNAIGMYDTVSGTFFTNQGTGEFIAGPEVGGL